MTDYVKIIKEKIKSHKTLAIISFIFIVFLAFAQFLGAINTVGKFFFPPISDIDDDILKEQAIILADDMLFFVEDRKNNQPKTDFDDWETSTQNLIEYNQQTRTLFAVRFNQRLAEIKEEFSIRNIIDEEFDQFYQQPTNYLIMEIVSLRLNAMAARL